MEDLERADEIERLEVVEHHEHDPPRPGHATMLTEPEPGRNDKFLMISANRAGRGAAPDVGVRYR